MELTNYTVEALRDFFYSLLVIDVFYPYLLNPIHTQIIKKIRHVFDLKTSKTKEPKQKDPSF